MTAPHFPPASGYPAPPAPPKNGFGVTGFVLGVVGAVFAVIPIVGIVAWPLVILGLVFSGIAIARVWNGTATNKGLSIAGLVVSAVGLALCIVWVAAFNKAVEDTQNALGNQSPTTPASTYRYQAPPTTTTPPKPIEKGDFTIGLKTVSKQCFGSYGCNLVVEPTITYAGTETQMTSYGTCSITYTITGNKDGEVVETAYGAGGTQFTISRTVITTANSKVNPEASVTSVSCS
ncbi:DUF4190 domain-containing protein [Amycolatopsis sp. NPDC006131]|uniref:DUF4190 domain-containing protein n=1 Tax=Amycolatopsis sp. NPDC006131 TaxID=3156731 RepID=UPI0033A0AE19